MSFCATCSTQMGPLVRVHALFCSSSCRSRAYRSRPRLPFPSELLERDRWIRRSVDKIPLQVSGRNASSTAPKTWSSYAAAEASGVGAGLGFVLNGDGIVCVDLDHCLDGSASVEDWAATIVDSIPDTFVEVSPSGNGLHVWGWSSFTGGRKFVVDGGGVEIYADARYLTMSGEKFRGSKDRLSNLDDFVGALLRMAV